MEHYNTQFEKIELFSFHLAYVSPIIYFLFKLYCVGFIFSLKEDQIIL